MAAFPVSPATSSEPDSSIVSEGGGNGSSGNSETAPWFLATAACHHMTGNRSLISDLMAVSSDQVVHAGNGTPMQVSGRGSVKTATVGLPDVWYVSGLTENLVSVGQLTELNMSVSFGGRECYICRTSDGSVVGKARMGSDGLYAVDFLNVLQN